MQQDSRTVEVSENREGQRLDNFLLREMKGLPRSALYRLIRTGQVRVNSKRAKPTQKLLSGDRVRIPPAYLTDKSLAVPPDSVVQQLREAVLFNDKDLLVLNKPAGLAVHGGSGLSWGLIDAARLAFSEPELDLAHRLDRETSGCLVLARSRESLKRIHDLLKHGGMHKSYLALLQGRLSEQCTEVDLPLIKASGRGGERVVIVDHTSGKQAHSIFTRLQSYQQADYVEVQITTGRTHQIRVHAQALGHPLAGDSKYGDKSFNKELRILGLKNLFLHAQRLDIPLSSGEMLPITAPLPEKLRELLDKLPI
ncbi:MAG: RluA family pseudouridine synthase [Xanthomonadales bacterium]|nr:RluA family pseudouridine synthase [Xanthomonadales bacterium]